MKVLWLTYDLPYPLVSGGKLRAYHLIKGLSQNHQIDLFSFIRSKDQLQYLPELQKYCGRMKTFKRPRVWRLRNVLRSGFSYLPFAAVVYDYLQVRIILERMLKEGDYDLVHFESFYPAVYLPFVKDLGFQTLMGNENVEYQIYRRYMEQKRFPLLRWLLSVDILKMRKFEERLWRLAAVNIAPSEDDADTILEVTGEECFVIPNAVDTASFSQIKREANDKPVCLFVGDFTYLTNQDAVEWLAKEIIPRFSLLTSHFPLLIVGRNPTKEIKDLASENVVIDSMVEDIRDAYARADVFLAPIRIGSGTRLKILEAMAAGLPVVSTTIGAEGLDVRDGENILLADDPHEFLQKTVELLKDGALRAKIGAAGRDLVRQKYDWRQSVQKLNEVYASFE